MRYLSAGIIALAVIATASAIVFDVSMLTAGEGCCAHCGCVAACQKTCRLVTEEKKVEVICWGCKCEDFCVGCHSTPGCTHCEEVCGACDETGKPSGVCAKPQRFLWTEWTPGSATVFTKKKLMKKTITKKVPSHKWVVEDLCPSCRAACQ